MIAEEGGVNLTVTSVTGLAEVHFLICLDEVVAVASLLILVVSVVLRGILPPRTELLVK